MVLTASLCDAPYLMSLSQVNNVSAYAVWLRLTMLQIYLYQYWTMAETLKEKEIGFSTTYSVPVHVSTYLLLLYKWIFFRIRLEVHNNNFSFVREKNKKYILVKEEKSQTNETLKFLHQYNLLLEKKGWDMPLFTCTLKL